MSTATEIARLSGARDTIRDKLIALGLASSTDKLDELATEIDSIVNRGAVTATVQEGDTYTIPAGYHNGSGTVTGVAGGGNYSLQQKSATPTKSQQSISPDNGFYGLSSVTVNAIPEAYQNVSSVTATAADVLSPKVIVDATGSVITGTMANNGAVSRTLDATTGNQSYTVPAGYHNGLGSVGIVLETTSATPTKSAQTITPTTGKVLSSVSVAAIPAAYQDVTNVDATAGDVLAGKTIVAADGTEVTGTMPNRGAVSKTLDATTGNQSYTVPAGYHNGSGTVAITLEEKSATPAATSQNVTPTSGKVLSKVTVAAIPSNWGNTTGDDGVAGDVLAGVKVHSNDDGDAVALTGTMPNNGALGTTLDATTDNQSYTIPAGYTSGGSVSITLQTKSATPTKSSQTISADTGKVLSSVTVAAIPAAYQDVTNVTATAADVLATKVFVNSSGTEVTGTMANNGTIATQTLSTASGKQSYTIPQGYHSGSGKVQITLETKTATPSASSQDITPSTNKVLSKVTVDPIPANWGDTTGDTAVAGNILSGITAHSISNGNAVALEGTMPNNGAVSKTLDATTNNQSYTVPAGYHNGSGTVSITLETKSATPSASSQTVTPTAGKVLSQVTVNAIPSNWGNTTGDNGVAGNVLAGVKVHSNSSGSAVAITGTMPNNGAISGSIDGLTTTSYTISAGYTSGGSVSLTSDIEDALAAI